MTEIWHKSKNLWGATQNAIFGLKILMTEKAARREVLLIIGSIILFAVSHNVYAFALVILSLILLAFEAINTAIETLCDFIDPNYNLAIKKTKDLAAAAIFIIILLIIACFIASVVTIISK